MHNVDEEIHIIPNREKKFSFIPLGEKFVNGHKKGKTPTFFKGGPQTRRPPKPKPQEKDRNFEG